MTRIFTVLAALNALILLVTFAGGTGFKLGLGLPYLVHFSLGLLSAITTLLVHCAIFTYFLGTGRWVKEVALAYHLPDEPLPKLTRELKRQTFPPALFAMLIVIITSAAGQGAQLQEWPWQVHATLAVATLLLNGWAYRVEYRNVRANAEVIAGVLLEVDRVRAEQGLQTNAEALQQEEAGR